MASTIVKKVTVGVPLTGVTSGAFNISNLSGVDITGVGAGDMLVYDAGVSKFLADSDTYIKSTDSAEIKSMFSAGGDLSYDSAAGQFSFNVETVYTKSNFDSDLVDATAAGTLRFADGSASAPSVSNTGDTNTGMFFPAADTLGFSVGGTSQVQLSDGFFGPTTDSDVDLGSPTKKFKDLYLSAGSIHIGGLILSDNNNTLKISDSAGVEILNTDVIDGTTSATSTTVADADRIVMNDNGTMVQVAVTDLAAYFDDEITAMPNLVTTGALNSGSITSGFGNINIGSSTFTTTGAVDISGTTNLDVVDIDGAVDMATTLAVAGNVDFNGDLDVDGTTNLDVVDIDGAVDMATTLAVAGNVDFNGDLDVDGTTNLDAVDIDGAVNMATTLLVTGNVDFNGDLDVDGTTNLDVVDIDGAVDMATTLAVAGNVDFNGDLDVDGTTNLDVVDIDGAVNMATTLLVTGNVDFNGDLDVDGTTNLDVVDIDGAVDMATTLNVTGVLSATSLDISGNVDVDGVLETDGLSINGTTVTSTAAELNIIDGGTSASSVTVVDADRVVMNDDGTMKQVTVTDLAAYFDDEITAMPNLVTTGALNAGSITSGFGAIDNGTSGIRTATFVAETGYNPDANDGATLGTTSLGFADAFLADGGTIQFGDDQDVILTHIPDAGLRLNSTMALQFSDASQFINAPSATVLDITATDEVEINATLADINANLDVSGTYTGGGLMTTGGNIVIPDGGLIGSASDVNAIQIEADGDIVISQDLAVAGNLTVTGTTTQVDTVTMNASNAVVFEGATADNNETTLTIIDPDADRTINLPNQSGTIPVLAAVSATAITSTPEELNKLDGVTATTADINLLDGVTSTTTELNIVDGGTSATSTTVADADRVVFNDAGTMKQVAVTDLSAYFDDKITAMPNLVSTGALDAGSITSGFGTINTGASAITTTGLISGGSLDIDDVLINGTTIGHTDDTDLITLADGLVTVAGEISVTTLDIGGTNVTATAAELNKLDGVTASAADINLIDGITNGTVIASKAIVTDANIDITGGRNITISGELDAATLDISGDADIDGTLEADAITIGGTTLAEFISDTTGAMFSSNTETGIAVTYQDADNTIDLALDAAQTTITSLLATDIKIGEDDQTKIDFETADEIHFYAANAHQIKLVDGAIVPVTDNDIDLGTSSLEFKDAFFDGTVTSDAFAGPLTGNVTGNVSGTAATVTGAAQAQITSLGTLTTLTVDSVIVNGATIGHTDDTDLITLADGIATVAGEISVTTLDIGGTNVTSTAAELNILDGVTSDAAELNLLDGVTSTTAELNILDGNTSGSSVTIADGDQIILNDGGVMKQVPVSHLNTYTSESANDVAADDISAGDAAVTITTSSGDITIDAAANDTDIIFKGTDGNADITMLTLDGSADGAATFKSSVIAVSLDISGDVDIDGTLEADAITVNGTSLAETISDTVGAMVGSNTETGITVTYQDADNTMDFALGAAQTTITSLLATDIKIGEDDQTKIDFETADEIHFYAANAHQIKLIDGALVPVTDNDIDLGTSSLEFKNAFFDGTVTSDAFAGPLTGDVTGNVSGSAATVTTAAQSAITSLGTLTALTVDDVVINGATIGHGDDTDLMTVADGILTVAGEVQMTTLDIGGTNVTSTAAELNALDGITAVVGELNALDLGSTAVGTAIASKAVILDSNKDYTGVRNFTVSGELDAATGDFSGDVDIDGTLEADAITVNGTALAEVISDTVGAMVGSNTETGIAVTYQDGDNTIDFALDAAQTTITSLLATDIKIGEDDQTKIDFETADEIHFYAANAHQIKLVDGALVPVTDNDIDLGTSSLEFKNAFFDGTVTSDAFSGPLTGDVTGNVSGSAATVTTAAQGNITSLGTLTALTVDDVVINGATIGHGDDTDLMTVADGILTVAGEVQMTTLDIGGTNVTSTAAELNILDGVTSTAAELNILDGVTATAAEINLIDGGTSRGTTAVADGDGILINDAGTMRMTTVQTVSAYMAAEGVGGANVVTTGALNSGSITSGFGNINTGSSTITTTGAVATGALTAGGILKTDDTTEATSTTDGSLQTDGGLSVAKDIVAGDDIKLLSDASVIAFGAGGDVTLTHVHDSGVRLNGAMMLQFGDAATFINQSQDGRLHLEADTEIEITGTTVDINGNVQISGTTAQTGVITANAGVVVDTMTLDGSTLTSTGDFIVDAAGDIILDADDDQIILKDAGTAYGGFNSSSSNFNIFAQVQDKDIVFTGDDGGSGITALTLDMSDAGAASFNDKVIVPDGKLVLASTAVTSTAAELNLLDGVTATTAEINLLDGGTSATSVTIVDADRVILNDGGTMKQVAMSDLSTYTSAGTTTAADNITVGDSDVDISTSSGGITIGPGASDADIFFLGNDGGSGITALTLDMSAAGAATFNAGVVATTGVFSGILKTDDATEATSTTDGSLQTDGGLSVVKDAVFGDDVKLLSDAAVLGFGADGDVTLTHVHNTGILLNSTNVIQFNDASQNIGAPSNAILDINATDEIELNATLVDINANVEISGNLTVSGTTTQVDTVTMNAANAVVFEGATADAHETTLTIIDPTADRTINLPNIGGHVAVFAAAHTTQISSTPAELNILDGVTSTAAELNILDGVTSTAAEINLIDGGTARGTTAVADGDGFLTNDGGTMRMTKVDTLATYMASKIANMGNLVETGALNAGTITSGFGNINTGSSTITTTGAVATGALTAGGILKTDDTTAATSTTDGSLQTDGGLSVAADAVIGDDIILLSDASIIHFGANKDVNLTHVHNAGLTLNVPATADNSFPTFTLAAGDNDIAANDVLGAISFVAPAEGAGTDAVAVAASIQAISEGNFAADNNATKLSFRTGASEVATEKMALSSAGILTLANDIIIPDDATIGSASDTDALQIHSDGSMTMSGGDLKLKHDGSILMFGANDEVKLTHVHNTGLLLNGTSVIQFNDASQNIGAPSNAILDINATDEIELNATLIDVNGNLDVSGTVTATGTSVFASLDISGDVDVDGTLEADAITLGGTALATSATTDTTNASNIGSGTLATARMAAAQTAITSLLATDIKIGEDDQTKIDFETANEIHFYAANAHQIKLVDGALVPVTDNDVDLGTTSLEFKNAFFDGTVTSDAFAGPLTGAVTGNADTATTLANARTIGGVSFNGSANINLPGVNSGGNQNTSGTAAIATAVTVSDNENTNENNVILFAAGAAGSGNLGVEADGNMTYNPSTGKITATGFVGAVTGDVTGDVTGNADTATALATARTIGGVSFDGSANINLPGVNGAGNQNTSGSAATLTNARTIGGVSFNGSANINLPGVNGAGNQNTSGVAAKATLLENARTINGTSFNGSANITLGTGSVTHAMLAADCIDGDNIGNDVINSEHYAAGSIDNEHIADDAINSEHYAAGSIDTAHIADGQITVGKMAANSINSDQYVDGSIDTAHYADNSITEAKMANDAIGSAELKTLATLLILDEDGSTLRTFHCAGA